MTYQAPEHLEGGLPEGGGEVVLLAGVVDLVGSPQHVDLWRERSVSGGNCPRSRVTVSSSVDPVVAEVDPYGGQDPGEGGVPWQGVEAVVGVDVQVECEEEARGYHTRRRSSSLHFTQSDSLHQEADHPVHHAHQTVGHPHPLSLQPLDHQLQDDHAEEVGGGLGHVPGGGVQVGEGGVRWTGQVEHPPHSLHSGARAQSGVKREKYLHNV